MTMFRHRQQTRRWAARVLFMWVFGLAVGIANACLTTGPGLPAGAVTAHLLDSPALSHTAPSHHREPLLDAGPSLAHDAAAQLHQGSLAKANCQDFCNKTNATTPPAKSALDDVQSHAMLATATVAVMPAPAHSPVLMWVPNRDGFRSPPIPIAFLRLTL